MNFQKNVMKNFDRTFEYFDDRNRSLDNYS